MNENATKPAVPAGWDTLRNRLEDACEEFIAGEVGFHSPGMREQAERHTDSVLAVVREVFPNLERAPEPTDTDVFLSGHGEHTVIAIDGRGYSLDIVRRALARDTAIEAHKGMESNTYPAWADGYNAGFNRLRAVQGEVEPPRVEVCLTCGKPDSNGLVCACAGEAEPLTVLSCGCPEWSSDAEQEPGQTHSCAIRRAAGEAEAQP